MRQRMARFMIGRNGQDQLNLFLLIVCLVLMVLSAIFRGGVGSFLNGIALALLILSWFRMLSKNIAARSKERDAFLKVRNRVTKKAAYLKNRWKDRKEYNYYTCPGCKAHVRIRKPGKGKTILVTCPKCRETFQKKT